MIKISCFECGTEMSFAERVGLREECPKCRADVHVCRNCEFHDPKVYNECRENQAEPVREKHRSNRCEWFTARQGGAGSAHDKAAALKAAAEALFKKK